MGERRSRRGEEDGGEEVKKGGRRGGRGGQAKTWVGSSHFPTPDHSSSHLKIDAAACCGEEKAKQQPPERLDVGFDLGDGRRDVFMADH